MNDSSFEFFIPQPHLFTGFFLILRGEERGKVVGKLQAAE